MADAAQEPQDSQDPVFSIQRMYLKEASLEQPNSPAIFLEQDAPGVDIQISVEAAQLGQGVFEVGVTGTVQTKVKDRTLFLAEVKQAGIFEIRNLTQEQLEHALEVACPQIVFPYLRGNVADLIQRAGFPPVHLGEINFQGMLEHRRQEEAAAAASGNGKVPEAADDQA